MAKKQQQIKKRSALSASEKATMLAIAIRNETVFNSLQGTLTAESFGEMDVMLALVWQVACDFYKQYQAMPTKAFLTARTQSLLEDNPDLLNDSELEDLGDLIDMAFNKKDWEEDVRTSPLYSKVCLDYVRLYLEETEVRKIREEIGSKGRYISDLPTHLEKYREKTLSLAALTDTDEDVLFEDGWDTVGGLDIFDTGCSFFNDYLNGGHAPGEVYGIMGPFGSCKTTMAVQLAVEGCRTCERRLAEDPDDQNYVFFFSFEARKAELRLRTLSCAARIKRGSLESMGPLGFKKLTDGNNLQKYEKDMFALRLKKGKKVLGERGRAAKCIKMLNRHLIAVDLSGYDKRRRGQGSGYVQEIARIVGHELRRRGPKAKALLVVVDYAGLMAKRHMKSIGADVNALRHFISDVPDMLRNMIADHYHCPVWIVHQLSGDANKKSPGAVYHHTDAAEARNFGENLDFAFIVGNLTDNQLGQITASKHRRTGPAPPSVIEVKGEMNMVIHRKNEYVVDKQTRTITEKDLAKSAAKTYKSPSGKVLASASQSDPYAGMDGSLFQT